LLFHLAQRIHWGAALARGKGGWQGEKGVAALRDEDKLTPDLVFRDPYLLDFLGIKDRYLEKDLEDAILRELETFLLELGSGFAFPAARPACWGQSLGLSAFSCFFSCRAALELLRNLNGLPI